MFTSTKNPYVTPSSKEIMMKSQSAICDLSKLDGYDDGGDLGSDDF